MTSNVWVADDGFGFSLDARPDHYLTLNAGAVRAGYQATCMCGWRGKTLLGDDVLASAKQAALDHLTKATQT